MGPARFRNPGAQPAEESPGAAGNQLKFHGKCVKISSRERGIHRRWKARGKDVNCAPKLRQQALRESILLLQRNLTSGGVRAASWTPHSRSRNYTRVFSRDAAICALGMAVSGVADLEEGAARSMAFLARHQAGNGQIPNGVDPETGETDFWYVGCIDATLWWLVAVDFLSKHSPQGAPLREELSGNLRGAIDWLLCQEHQKFRLLQQNEASDWADIMPRSGFVLYTNALWYHVKRLFGLPGAEETRANSHRLFLPHTEGPAPEDRRLRLLAEHSRDRGKGGDLYLSYVNFFRWGEEGDVFGNLLAVLFGLADRSRAGRVLDALKAAGVDRPFPVRAVCTPLAPSGPEWREYMGRHRQNGEYEYHNGGAWPFLGGFWVLALSAMGREAEAREGMSALARMNRRGRWGFREWFHGATGEPRGMAGQSWNAGMYLLAEVSLERDLFPKVPPI